MTDVRRYSHSTTTTSTSVQKRSSNNNNASHTRAYAGFSMPMMSGELGKNTIPCSAYSVWMPFNKVQIYHALRLVRDMPAVSICFGLIEHEILNGGVDIRGRDFDKSKNNKTANNKKKKKEDGDNNNHNNDDDESSDKEEEEEEEGKNKHEEDLLRIRWANLFRRALEYIFAIGFVFFQIIEDTNSEMFPEIVDLEDTGVEMEYCVNALQQFKFRIKRVEHNAMMIAQRVKNDEITNDYEDCLLWMHSRPNCFGFIQSEITRVIASLHKEQQVWQTFLIVARHHESHDVYVSKDDKDNSSGGNGPIGTGKQLTRSLLEVCRDAVVDPCASDENCDSINGCSTVDSVNLLLGMMNTRVNNNQNKRLKTKSAASCDDDKQSPNPNDPSQPPAVPDADSSGLPRASRIRPMGTNMKVVVDKPPGMPYDYREMASFLMDSVCDILSLPTMVWKSKDLFSNKSTSRQTNNGDQATRIYDGTIRRWAKALKDMGKHIYHELKDRKRQRDLILLQHTLQKEDMEKDEYDGVIPFLQQAMETSGVMVGLGPPSDTPGGGEHQHSGSLVDQSYNSDNDDDDDDDDLDEYEREKRRQRRRRRYKRRYHPFDRQRVVHASAGENTNNKEKKFNEKESKEEKDGLGNDDVISSSGGDMLADFKKQQKKEEEENKGTKRKRNKNDIDFEFPSLTKIEHVLSVFNNGYMSLDVFQEYIARNTGIPLDDLLEFKSGTALPAKVPFVLGSEVDAAGFHATTRAKLEEIEMKKKADEIKIQLQMKLAEHKLDMDREKLQVDKQRYSMDLESAEQQMNIQKEQGQQQLQLDKQKAETTMSTMKAKAKLQQQSHSSSSSTKS